MTATHHTRWLCRVPSQLLSVALSQAILLWCMTHSTMSSFIVGADLCQYDVTPGTFYDPCLRPWCCACYTFVFSDGLHRQLLCYNASLEPFTGDRRHVFPRVRKTTVLLNEYRVLQTIFIVVSRDVLPHASSIINSSAIFSSRARMRDR